MRKAIPVFSIHRSLRAARYQRRGAEGAITDTVEIRTPFGDLSIDYDDFEVIAKAILKSDLGPSVWPDDVDF